MQNRSMLSAIAQSQAYARKGDYVRAMADRGHLLWLRFGILGITIRLCLLILSIGIAIKLISKRLREGPGRGQQAHTGISHFIFPGR